MDDISNDDARSYLSAYAPDQEALVAMDQAGLQAYYTKVHDQSTRVATESVATAVKARVPENYEIVLPKDSKLPETDIERIATIAREQGLTNKEAQLVMNERSSAVDELHDTQKQMLADMQVEWKADVAKDPELGGDNLKETERLVQLPMEKFMNDSLRSFLKETGYETHPDMVRFLIGLGKAMDEDGQPGSGLGGGAGNAGKTPQDILYDNTPVEA